MQNVKEKFNNLISIAREKSEKYVYSFFLPLLTALITLLFWIANLQLVGLAIVIILGCFVLIVFDDFLPVIPFMFMIPMCFRNPTALVGATLIIAIVLFALLVLAIIFHLIRYSIKISFNAYFYMLLGIVGIFVFGGFFTGDIKNYFKAIDLFVIAAIMPIAIHVFFYNKIKLNDKIDCRKYFCLCFIIATSLACMQLCYTFFYIKVIGPWPYGEMPGGFCWANSNHIASLVLIAVPLCCYMMTSATKLWGWFIELGFLYLSIMLSGSDASLAALLFFTPFLMYALYKNVYRSNRKALLNFYFALIAFGTLFVSYLCLFRFDNFFAYIVESSSSNGRNYPYSVALENFKKSPIFGVGFGNGRASLDAIVHIHDTNGFFHSTFMHVLACAGILGVLVYVAYYLVRIKCITKGNTLFGYFSLLSFFLFGIYALVENSEFNIVLMFMATLITVVNLTNEKGSDDKPLPLYVKVPKFCSL